jgi:nitrous oxidase accessory protein
LDISSRRKFNIKAVVLISACLILLPVLHPVFFTKTVRANQTWTVDADGWGIRSIQQAINNANDGDTILVLPGIYYEHLIVDKGLSIIGEDQHNTIIDGGDTGIVVTVAASNVTIKGFTVQHGGVGIRLAGGEEGNTLFDNTMLLNAYYGIYGDLCGSTVIANNNVSFNGWHGIFLYGSEPCVLDSNLILSNGIDGVFIRASSNNTVTGNLVSDNRVCGIDIYSNEDPLRAHGLPKNNAIEHNHVLNNSCGVKIGYFGADMSSTENHIYENFIGYNELGLNISGANGNSVHHNNFINNSIQVSTNESFNNTWDDSYYGGGNYWSDCNSTDLSWGPNQDETGSDGITDFPYLISTNPGEEDQYPFMYTNGWLSSQEVTIVSPSNKTYRSNTVPLLVTTNKPARLSYSLDSQTNSTITENLVLSDLPAGTHNVTVHASDNLDDKASSEVLFTVTFFGDINLDGTVNILDIFVVAQSFDCTPESERWNPNADLNNDRVINILDIFLVANEYGKTM